MNLIQCHSIHLKAFKSQAKKKQTKKSIQGQLSSQALVFMASFKILFIYLFDLKMGFLLSLLSSQQ